MILRFYWQFGLFLTFTYLILIVLDNLFIANLIYFSISVLLIAEILNDLKTKSKITQREHWMAFSLYLLAAFFNLTIAVYSFEDTKFGFLVFLIYPLIQLASGFWIAALLKRISQFNSVPVTYLCFAIILTPVFLFYYRKDFIEFRMSAV